MSLYALFVKRTEIIVYLVYGDECRKNESQEEKNKAFDTFEHVSQ